MQFVHVACLNTWRASSASGTSYFRCDACHYDYRLERVRLADFVLSNRVQQLLAVLIFLGSTLVLGAICWRAFPGLLPQTLDHMQLPPGAWAVFHPMDGKGNAACWNSGYTYELCCPGPHGGNPACWDGHHSFEACCQEPSATWRTFHAAALPALAVVANGGIAMSAIGFALFVLRQLREGWGDMNGQWHLIMMAASFATFNKQAMTRFVAFVGTLVAYRELHWAISAKAKAWATAFGERVLEVS